MIKYKTSEDTWGNILAEAARRRISRVELVNAMDISDGAYYRRMKRPELMRFAEVERAAKLFGMKAQDLIGGVR